MIRRLLSSAAAVFFACSSAGTMAPRTDASMTDSHVAVSTGSSSAVELEMRRVRYKDQQLVILREPKSGVTWWTTADQVTTSDRALDDFVESSVFPHDSAMFFIDHKLIRFTLVIPELLVGESTAIFASLDVAERAIVAGKAPLERWLSPRLSIPRDFLEVPNLAHSPFPQIRAATRTKDGWLITIAGPNGDLADVSLDAGYRVMNLRIYR